MTPAVREDAWLSTVLGHAVFAVDAAGDATDSLAGQVSRHSAGRARGLYFAKVPVERVDVSRALASIGMYTVDAAVTLAATTLHAKPVSPSIVVTTATDADHSGVLRVAGTAFRYSRFHLDPLIADDTAHAVKRQWAANCLAGHRGEAVLVARLDGVVAGFLAVTGYAGAHGRVRVIDLIAVAPDAHRRGVGAALLAEFASRYAGSSERLEVGTQLANIPSLRFYDSVGFKPERAAFVMHMHVGTPG